MMFFLFRCLIWLGLVFSQIAAQQGTDATALLGPAARAASQQTEDLGRTAMDAAGRSCMSSPETCLALAAQASRLAGPNALPSRDTLIANDRIPAWRLRSSNN
jgi:hypothetical protein